MLQPTCPRCEATYDPPRDTCATCAPGGRAIHLVDQSALRATPAPARYLLGLVLEGRFRVDGYLGGGGMSSVYVATQLSVDRTVALKIIRGDLMSDAAAEARFEQEAKVVAQLAHPYVVQVYDFGRAALDEGGAPVFYIAMERVDGQSLAEQVALGPLPLERAVAIGRDVLRGLEFAHGRGVVHRDLKPDNVLVDARSGHARLLDFGIAKILGQGNAGLTGTGMHLGTPDYMAPEQWLGEPVDARTDIYAFGCLLFEMLTGGPPYPAPTPVAKAPKHVHGPIPEAHRPDGEALPVSVQVVLRRCLAKSPAARYPDAAAALRALEVLGGADAQRTSTMEVVDAAGLGGSRPPWALLGLVGLVLVGGLAFWLWRTTPGGAPEVPEAGRATPAASARHDAAPPDAAPADAARPDAAPRDAAPPDAIWDAAPPDAAPDTAPPRRRARPRPPSRPPGPGPGVAPNLKVEEL